MVGCCLLVFLVVLVCALRRHQVLKSNCLEDQQQRTLSYNPDSQVWGESVPAPFKPMQSSGCYLVPPILEAVEESRPTSGAMTPATSPRGEGCAIEPRSGIARGPFMMPPSRNGIMFIRMPNENSLPLQQPKGDGGDNLSVRLDFHTNDNALVTCHAWFQPLGIRPDPADPTVVGGFFANSYAAASLNIEKGWKFAQIGDEELNGKLSDSVFNQKLSSHMSHLPVWPLRLTFKMPPTAGAAADECTFLFTEQPLGMEVSGRDSLKVSKVHVGSPAHNAAVREGSFITALGGGVAAAQTGTSIQTAELQALKDDISGRQLREAVSLLPSSGIKFGSSNGWKRWGTSIKL